MSIYDRQLSVSGGVLHHLGLLLAAEELRDARRPCAWCDHELGLPLPPVGASHTICARHLERMRDELNRRGTEAQRMAA